MSGVESAAVLCRNREREVPGVGRLPKVALLLQENTHCGVHIRMGIGIRGLMRGMANLPKVTRSY